MEENYSDVVSELADNVEAYVREEKPDYDDLLTWIHETIDGHSWVIWTNKAKQVVCESQNSGAGVDEGIVDHTAFRNGIPWSQLAYCALERDLINELHSRGRDVNDPESWFEDEEEDEEEDEAAEAEADGEAPQTV